MACWPPANSPKGGGTTGLPSTAAQDYSAKARFLLKASAILRF